MIRRFRWTPRWIPLAGTAALLAGGLSLAIVHHGRNFPDLGTGSVQAASVRLPSVRHVFVIMLENEDYASTFGDPTADRYLASSLPKQGALLEDYYATGHESNDNYISIVSGQPPNVQNQADCQIFDNFIGVGSLSGGVEAGTGCVYPASVANIGTQLTAKGLTWKAYEEDMGNDPNRETAACGHPALNSRDGTQNAELGDGYAVTRPDMTRLPTFTR
jgi:hypothetical protein